MKEQIYAFQSAIIGFCVGFGATWGIAGNHPRALGALFLVAITSTWIRHTLGRDLLVKQLRALLAPSTTER